MDIIQDILIYQTQMMRNLSLGPYPQTEFSPPEYIVVVNALFYASLGVMLLAAFIAMLIKSWVREFDRGLQAMSLPEQRAKTREFRYLGIEYWRLPEMVSILPLLIQISLLLFAIGLMIFLFQISKPSFGVTTAIFGFGFLYYAITTSISVFVTSSPFHSPLSRALGKLYQRVHAHLCPGIHVFSSRIMDVTPATVLGRLHRHFQIFLLKSRPFQERDFVEPITAATMDEVQLSTASSALQRIHESVPNSQHSKSLQWSVWQVAGSPAFRMPPLFNLPSWILDRAADEEYFSCDPPIMLVALVAVSLRAPRAWDVHRITTVRTVLRRAEKVPWAQLVIAVFDRRLYENSPGHAPIENIARGESNPLMNAIRGKELNREESLWLLNTLSELCCGGWVQRDESFFIEMCIAILSDQASTWDYKTIPDIILLDAVMTFAAISCSPNETYRLNTLSNSRQYPWLLLSLRNHEVIGRLMEDAPQSCHKQLISLLFLVLYAFAWRYSDPLAVQYFAIITAKGDFPLYSSALTAIAPFIGHAGLSAIGRLLVAPQTRDLTQITYDSLLLGRRAFQEELLKNYDLQLGASQHPDPNIFAILFVLSTSYNSRMMVQLDILSSKMKNPWLRLAARVIARLDIPDGSGMDLEPFRDSRVHNMIGAMSFRRYMARETVPYTESQFLASFLESREFIISSLALNHYMKTIISNSDPLAPTCCLSNTVCAVFNLVLPDHQLRMGWNILETFVDGFENLAVEWRQTFAEAFFTISYRLIPTSRGNMEENTVESELYKILSWEYFHEQDREPEFTDSEFSGLDWMAMAWSLHLSQQCGLMAEDSTQGDAQSCDSGLPTVNEEFILRALFMLLGAAPCYRIVPIVPKLREFAHWFDDAELSEYHGMISSRIEEVVREHQEHQRLDKFHKFNCMWHI